MRALLLATALAIPALGLAAETNLLQRLPADTLYAVGVTDADALREKWEKHPVRAMWEAPEMKTIRDEVGSWWEEAETDFNESTGLDAEEVISAVHGGAFYFSTWIENREVGDVYFSEWDMCFVAEVGESDADTIRKMIDGLVEKAPEDAKRSRTTFNGADIYSLEFIVDQPAEDAPDELEGLSLAQEIPYLIEWTFTDGHFVICEGRNKPMTKILSALAGTGEKSARLGDTPSYRKAVETTRSIGDFVAWGQVDRLLSDRFSGDSDRERAQRELSSIDNLGGGMVSVGMGASTIDASMFLEAADGDRGLLGIFQSGGSNTLGRLEYAPEDALSATTISFDLLPAWTILREILERLNKQGASMVTAYLTMAKTNYQVDVEQEIVANIGGEHLMYEREMPSEVAERLPAEMKAAGVAPTRNTVIVGVRDGAALGAAVDKMMTTLTAEPFQAPLERLTFQGFTVWTMREDVTAELPERPAMALTPTGVVLSNSLEEVQEATRRLAGRTGRSLASVPAVREALDRVPRENLRAFEYNGPNALRVMMEAERGTLALLENMTDADVPFSVNDIPAGDWWAKRFTSAHSWVRNPPGAFVCEASIEFKQ